MGIFKRRLKSLKGDLSDTKFARKCDLPYTTLKGYLAGKTPSLDRAAKIARAFDKSLDWLYGSADASSIATRNNRVALPRFAVEASAGNGAAVLTQDVDDFFIVNPDWLSRYLPPGAQGGVIEARGDSMEPTIHDGDLPLLNFNIGKRNIEAGGVFVVNFDEWLMVKRLQIMTDGTILISSDNDYYQPERIAREDADQRMNVLAQVVWVGGAVRRRKG